MNINGVLLDLDGTVYLGKQEVPGASLFVRRLRERNLAHLFVTNRSNRTPQRICEQLQDYGIPCDPDDILTSSQATARYLERGSVFFIGEIGLQQALEEQGLTITDRDPDYVVVGFDREMTYAKVEKACRLIDDGASYIATNPDRGLRTEDGIAPGTGAIVAAVSAGCGREPVFIGKPEPLIIEMAVRRLGLPKQELLLVGDNIDTDLPAGERAGVPTALILTGISSRDDLERVGVRPTWTVEGFDELSTIVFG